MREMLDALQRRNGRVRLAISGEQAVALQMRLSVTSAGLRGALSMRLADGSSSERAVEGATCQAVVEALSLTAAIALASVAPAEEGERSEAVAPGVESPATAVSSPATSTSSARRRAAGQARVAFEAGAQASLSQMVAPHLNTGGGLLARARLERGNELSPSLTLSVTHTRSELLERSRHAELQVTGISMTVCPIAVRPHRRFRLEPCVAANGARLSATGRNLLSPRSVARSWWGTGALLRLSVFPLPELAVEVEGGGLVPLVSRRFVAEPTGQSLGETPSVSPFTSVGLVYAL